MAVALFIFLVGGLVLTLCLWTPVTKLQTKVWFGLAAALVAILVLAAGLG